MTKTSKLAEKLSVSQEELRFMHLITNHDAKQAVYTSNTSLTTYQTALCQNPEDYKLNNSPRGNWTPCIILPTAKVRLTSCKAAMRRPDLNHCAGLRSRTCPEPLRARSLCTHRRFLVYWKDSVFIWSWKQTSTLKGVRLGQIRGGATWWSHYKIFRRILK